MDETLLAALLGAVQGALEWLPVSSEGALALARTAVGDTALEATQFALFLHVGTAVAATVYYRADIRTLLGNVREWRPETAFAPAGADLSFVVLAMATSFATGGIAYLSLEELVSTLSGGAFVALIGALLVVTGLIQYVAEGSGGRRADPDAVDAVLVGALQGLAILPGVSRSGTTVSALLLRGHDGEGSLRLSFLLSIPAALAAGVLVLLETGLPGIEPVAAVVALAVSAVVGYLTVGTLVALVRKLAFWAVCTAFGLLAVASGLAIALL